MTYADPDDFWHDYRDECRTEDAHAYEEPDWQPDDAELHELFPDDPPRTRRHSASDHARDYR